MAKKKQETVDFEQALAELESIVESMEKGDQGLEEALKSFERGIALTRQCQTALQAAEQKVNILMEKEGVNKEEAFKLGDEEK